MADLDEAEQAALDVAEAREALEAAQEAAAAAQRALLDAQAAHDAAVIAAQGPVNPHQDQIDRMAYIKRQADLRAERMGIAVQLREGAPSPDALDPHSPLDKSMQRKTARGHARPKVPAKD